MNAQLRRELLGTRYLEEGREVGTGIDCLGVVLFILQQQGQAIPDPWETLATYYANPDVSPGEAGFPPGWERAAMPVRDGDVLLFFGVHHWSAIVHEGYVWSSHPEAGVWAKPVGRLKKKPREVWRRC